MDELTAVENVELPALLAGGSAARTSTVRALSEAARRPRRTPWLIAVSSSPPAWAPRRPTAKVLRAEVI